MAETFPCSNCGASLEYAPGTAALRCPYCGTVNALPETGRTITEHSYSAWRTGAATQVAPAGAHVFECQNCRAHTESEDVSRRCPFCGSSLVRDLGTEAGEGVRPLVVPEGVVAFHVDKRGAQDSVRQWLRTRRFAPGSLRKVSTTEALAGTYLPFWTYDAPTRTDYEGQRGDYYYVTQTYTVVVDGRPQTRTRQVRHTRWRHASGRVERHFDDVLVPASTRVERRRLDRLEPWGLESAAPYQAGYLAGHQTLRYDVEPDAGLLDARTQMEEVIEGDVRADIGGDEQQVHRMDVRYGEILFKLLLMPIWIAAYVYSGTTYQVIVNANTGEVVGERPWSAWKIALAVVAGVLLVAAIVAGIWWYQQQAPQ